MIFIRVIALIIGLFVVFFCLLSMFPIIRIEGDSMYPTFKEGEYVIGCRLLNRKKCKIGKIYVIHLRDIEGEPYYIIKRLHKKVYNSSTNSYEYFFLGDNLKVSADSRHYGLFSSDKIVAVIIGKKGRR